MHERIEQRNCKGRVAVVGTPDHTLGYKLIARRAKRGGGRGQTLGKSLF